MPIFCIFWLACHQAKACPAAILNGELPEKLKVSRADLKLFALRLPKGAAPAPGSTGIQPTWHQLPMQIDAIDDDGRFEFFNHNNWMAERLNTNDRLAFYTDDFGVKLTKELASVPLPCMGKVKYEFGDPRDPLAAAYLIECNSKERVSSDLPRSEVAFLKDRHVLESSNYRYTFNGKNQMLFDRVEVGTGFGNQELVASDSELLIRSDVKRFFTMHFDSGRIESYLEQTRPGVIGTIARVSFYLKILFFKIKMSLTTDVTFFRDVGHIPMVVQLPVDAQKYLNEKSGILYHWQPAPGVSVDEQSLKMPTVDPELMAKGFAEASKNGLTYCEKETCRYSFSGQIGDRSLKMEFAIPMYMVKAGFYPQIVRDVATYNEKMGWSLSEKHLKTKRMGLYFEVSGLQAGGHPWDFWLRLGERNKLAGVCPQPVEVRRI